MSLSLVAVAEEGRLLLWGKRVAWLGNEHRVLPALLEAREKGGADRTEVPLGP